MWEVYYGIREESQKLPQIIIQSHEVFIVIGVIIGAFILSQIFSPILQSIGRGILGKRRDSDYLLKSDFIKLCHENRANCKVITDFASKLDGFSLALKVLIVHTVTDKAKQDEALRFLR